MIDYRQMMDDGTDRWMDGWMDRQIQIDRQINWQTDRWLDTDRWTGQKTELRNKVRPDDMMDGSWDQVEVVKDCYLDQLLVQLSDHPQLLALSRSGLLQDLLLLPEQTLGRTNTDTHDPSRCTPRNHSIIQIHQDMNDEQSCWIRGSFDLAYRF